MSVMRRGATALALVLATQVGAQGRTDVSPGQGSTYPLAVLPAGWVYLERGGIDTWDGAYHDRESGVFASVVAAPVAGVIVWSAEKAQARGARVETGQRDGVPYMIERNAAPSQRSGREPIPEGCEQIAVHFLPEGPKGPSWHFRSVVCNDDQRRRFMGVALGMAPVVKNWPQGATPARTRLIKRSEVEGLPHGTEWPLIRSRLGAPSWAEKLPGGGFQLTYFLERVGEQKGWRALLDFDQQRQLAAVQIVKGGDER